MCPLAPNNVNTMAAAAIAAESLGFDGVQGSIVSDPNLIDSHIVEIEIFGLNGFHVKTVRTNPAKIGNVTGQATYASFWASLLRMKLMLCIVACLTDCQSLSIFYSYST